MTILHSELRELIKLLKEEKISYFRQGELVLKLDLSPSPIISDMIEKANKANEYSDDEILMDPFVGLDIQDSKEGELDESNSG